MGSNTCFLSLIALLLCASCNQVTSFTVAPIRQTTFHTNVLEKQLARRPSPSKSFALRMAPDAAPTDDNDDEEEEDPMAEWKRLYPDLEFVDYNDPEYQVDQGEELLGVTEDDTEERIEEMREERRRRNDEFQFETYLREILQSGDKFHGEWTIYKASFAEGDVNEFGMPALKKARDILKVISSGERVIVDPDAEWRVDGEHIIHEDVVFTEEGEEEMVFASEIMAQKYWPSPLKSNDFRGPAGIMKVGNGHTICETVPLNGVTDESEPHDGPFKEMRTEIGIHNDDIRFRLKLDYRIDENADDSSTPPLRLDTMIVCRERRNQWPRKEGYAPSEQEIALFGPPGAEGGLYDPPPVGSEEQSGKYLYLDLDGGATVLFPYEMDQSESAFQGNGWVTTLDWSPADIRYQVDRKVLGGKKIKGLKTLELTEVEKADARRWRPTDGGADMRQ